ncbi:MAG: VCBS domain-containing protein [Campylobacterales bacterium]|nr:VCBS domain-containing protein [Campylobacterales bacterium]
MQKIVLSIILMIIMANCGGSSNSPAVADTNNSTANTTQDSNNNLTPYPNDSTTQIPTVIEAESSYEELNNTTTLTPNVVAQAIEEAGYSFEGLNLENLFRGSVDYQTYLYLTNQTNTIAILGNYVYALQDNVGRKVLFTIDGPSEFDAMERGNELVLRANLIESSSKLRYVLPFAPIGYVNINTTTTNDKATVGTLIQELRHAFEQFTLTNPKLTIDALEYRADYNADTTYILCNDVEMILDPTQTMVEFNDYLSSETSTIHCKTKEGVLIGSIVQNNDINDTDENNETIPDEDNTTQPDNNDTSPDENQTLPTTISGDLYRSIYETTPNTEGTLYTNKDSVSFIADRRNGNYGVFELLSDGNWLYELNTNSSAVKNLDSISRVIDNFNIKASDNTLSTIKVTIMGIDTLIVGDTQASIAEDFTDIISGQLSIQYSNATFKPVAAVGEFGTFVLDQNGLWKYKLDYRAENVRLLSSTNNGFESFTISTTDNTTQEINITIEGIDNSFIAGDTRGIVDEINYITSGEVYTVNALPSSFVQLNTAGYFGELDLLVDGVWLYTLDITNDFIKNLSPTAKTQDIFNISTVDGISGTIVITINGSATPLEINASEFDAIPTHIESQNNANVTITFPTVTASGDEPIVTNYFNGVEVSAGSQVTLLGGQSSTIEINVSELSGKEEVNLSKTIHVSDTTPPLPPLLSNYPATTTLKQIQADVNAAEDNVSIYVNGIYVDTIVSSSNTQTITLDTSGIYGDKTFRVTLKDQVGNESNATIISITTYNPDSPTNFSGVSIKNMVMEGYLMGGILAGSVTDANGISSMTIEYEGDPNISSYTGTGVIDKEWEHPFGTNYTIRVIDNLGNTRSSSGTITEQDEPTEFQILLSLDGGGQIKDTSLISDPNGIQKIVISYYTPDGGFLTTDEINYTTTFPDSLYPEMTMYTFYIYSMNTPWYAENTTFKISVLDDLNNTTTYNGAIRDDSTDFSNVLIGDNNDSTSYLLGGVSDPNGIEFVKIYYDDNSTAEITINGANSQNVGLDNIPPKPTGTWFTIEVKDSNGNTEEYSDSLGNTTP